MFTDQELSLLYTDQFVTRLYAYTKSRCKSKVHLVTSLVSYLKDLEALGQRLNPTSHRYKAVQRRLCVNSTDLCLTVMDAKDWKSLEEILTTLILVEDLVGVVSLYRPLMLPEICKELVEVQQYVDKNLESVMTFAEAEECPVELITFYKAQRDAKVNKQQVAVLRQELSRLGLDKNALQQLLNQL